MTCLSSFKNETIRIPLNSIKASFRFTPEADVEEAIGSSLMSKLLGNASVN